MQLSASQFAEAVRQIRLRSPVTDNAFVWLRDLRGPAPRPLRVQFGRGKIDDRRQGDPEDPRRFWITTWHFDDRVAYKKDKTEATQRFQVDEWVRSLGALECTIEATDIPDVWHVVADFGGPKPSA